MAKKQPKSKFKIKGTTILAIFAGSLIIAAIGYSTIISMIPVNADFPMFGAPANIYIKAIKSNFGEDVFAKQSTKGGKSGGPPTGAENPVLIVAEENLVSIHFINEDTSVTSKPSQHDLNIDEFNVHSKKLNHFDSQTITFFANKKGTFDYYCSIHPQMKGKIVVE